MRIAFLVAVAVLLFGSSFAYAQPTDAVRQRRRAFLEELIRNFTDDQPKSQQPLPERTVTGSPQLQSARKQTASFDRQLDALIAQLRNEEVSDPRMRSMLADALQIKSYASQVATGAQQTDVDWIATNFPTMDRSWRVLSYRIAQEEGVNNRITSAVANLNKTNDGLGKTLNVPPQIDRAQLNRLVSSLDMSFQHLLQDLYYDRQGQPDRDQLIREGQTMLTQIRQASAIVDRGNYQSVVKTYGEAVKDWRSYSSKLRNVAGERVRNDILQIEEIGRAIQEQLWLKVEVDPDYLLQLLAIADGEIEQVFRSVTLNDLLDDEAPRQLFTDARNHKKASLAFRKSVESKKDLKELYFSSRAMKKEWEQVLEQLELVNSPTLARRLATAKQSMELLQRSLGDGPQITRRDLQEMAASLDMASTQIENFAKHTLPHARNVSAEFRRDFTSAAHELHSAAHNMHDILIAGRNANQLEPSINKALESWHKLRPLLAKAREIDRDKIAELQRQIQPLLLKLEIIYSE